ncbi:MULTISPECIES: PQQ-binding-like beta-propeller repeat protein [unclassified Streptomyces]|uniref:outer membrane protein assembly factor BamB family protein n=1 Tax=unclassified Streptomyces TaxID=2593676 RepID=UPI002253688C|nr:MULTISPECIES: PQQ-binding-like beta-propeller repeat protein [unclassified Streptomyces]MCX5048755.1 PQQ-like beta-propeller repeat protein [Streptomyces sp. NBC_00474]
MTQPPPPPPHQPPQQGGFGPPQDQPPQQPGFGAPQQPGYGYPQAPQPPQSPQAPPPPPPQQPGYGYPQAPQQPQQPQTPPGYGYPGQQPNPYGQTPNPYGQQPGYGYPQPTMPLQPQAGQPAGGRGLSTQTTIIVAAVVAIALIVGGGIWYASSGKGDDKKHDTASSSGGTGGKDGKGDTGGSSTKGDEKVPANPGSHVLFQVPEPKVDDSTVVAGSWLTDKAYVKAGVAEINGYDPEKGSKLWTIALPGPVCEASSHTTADNKTAIVFQPKMPAKNSSAGCSQVAAIDLDAGKKLWTKTVNSGDRPISLDNVTVSANTVAAGSSSGGAAWDVTSGKSLWAPKPTDTCYDAGYGGGEKLVAVRKCGSYEQRQLHIQTIDPKSGKVISEYKMTSGIEYASVVSTNPLVVAADVGDSAGDGSGISDFFSIDNKTGKLINRISAPGDQFAAKCDGITRVEACTGIAVGNGRLYIPTEEHDGTGEYSQTNEIVAFDLATGKQTGQRADAGDGFTITPLRMDGANVIAYKRPPYDKGGQVVSIDGGSFKETKLLENPATESVRDVETSMSPEYSEIIYAQGHLYMSGVYADKPSSTGDKEYLAIGFGAGG